MALEVSRTGRDAWRTLHPVIVLSDRLWREQFGGDRTAIGRTARLDGQTYTVLGVMPPRFDENTDAWIPLRESATASPRDDRQYTAIARIRPGVSLESATAELNSIAGRLASDHPPTNGGWELTPTPFERLRARESGGGWFQLQAGVAVLLVVGGANANLLLARAVTRRRELAIRTALGATRWERFRLVFMEGAILAALASALGAVLSLWGTGAVTALAALPPSVHVPVDALTVAAAVVLGLAIAVIGVLVARAGGRMLQSLVYGVETTDPVSFAAAAGGLFLVVIGGTWIPARRTSATDPAIALKVD